MTFAAEQLPIVKGESLCPICSRLVPDAEFARVTLTLVDGTIGLCRRCWREIGRVKGWTLDTVEEA